MKRAIRRSVSINVFTRAPVPGQVKTRLIPVLGAEGAAALLRRMARVTLARAREADVGPLTLWCTPAPDAFLRALAEEFGAGLRRQHGADLGERMHHALRTALKVHAGALLLGSDCPFVSGGDLRRARSLLFEHDHRVVLGPARDGGYYLLAARSVEASLFDGVRWGSGEVLDQTRRRLDALGWSWAELDPKHDVDRPRDLVHVTHLMESGSRTRPRAGSPGPPPSGAAASEGPSLPHIDMDEMK